MKKGYLLFLYCLFCSCAFAFSPLETALLNAVKSQEKTDLRRVAQAAVDFVNGKYQLGVTELTQLDPAYLYVYTNYLYETGARDAAVVWFYVARYRGEIIGSMESENSVISPQQYQQLCADAGALYPREVPKNGRNGLTREQLYTTMRTRLWGRLYYYVGNDIDNWIVQMKKALELEKSDPFDPFQAIPADQLRKSEFRYAKRQAKRLTNMVQDIEANRVRWEQWLGHQELIRFNGAKYHLQSSRGNSEYWLNEYLPAGVTFEDYIQMFAVRAYDGVEATPEQVAATLVSRFLSRYPQGQYLLAPGAHPDETELSFHIMTDAECEFNLLRIVPGIKGHPVVLQYIYHISLPALNDPQREPEKERFTATVAEKKESWFKAIRTMPIPFVNRTPKP